MKLPLPIFRHGADAFGTILPVWESGAYNPYTIRRVVSTASRRPMIPGQPLHEEK